MKIKLIELKSVIRETVSQLSEHTVTVVSSDGKTYQGDKRDIERALINYGSSSPEREAIFSGAVKINDSILSTLKRKKIVKSSEAPAKSSSRSRSVYGSPRKQMSPSSAQNKLNAMIKRYAKNWSNFSEESPDTQPEDAAFDAADGFFYEAPSDEWMKYAKAAGLSKTAVREIVADHVYDAMTSGKK